MLRRWVVGVGCVLAVLAGPCQALEKGDKAPALDLQTRDAQPLKLSLRGELVYLDFWASWCGPCKQSFPWMNAMHARYSAQGLRVFAINVDQKPADAARFYRRWKPARCRVRRRVFSIALDSYCESRLLLNYQSWKNFFHDEK